MNFEWDEETNCFMPMPCCPYEDCQQVWYQSITSKMGIESCSRCGRPVEWRQQSLTSGHQLYHSRTPFFQFSTLTGEKYTHRSPLDWQEYAGNSLRNSSLGDAHRALFGNPDGETSWSLQTAWSLDAEAINANFSENTNDFIVGLSVYRGKLYVLTKAGDLYIIEQQNTPKVAQSFPWPLEKQEILHPPLIVDDHAIILSSSITTGTDQAVFWNLKSNEHTIVQASSGSSF